MTGRRYEQVLLVVDFGKIREAISEHSRRAHEHESDPGVVRLQVEFDFRHSDLAKNKKLNIYCIFKNTTVHKF